MSEGAEVVKAKSGTGNLKTLLERYIECAEYLVQQCRELGSITGAAKLERKCAAELKYLRSLNRRKGGYDVTHLRSSNLGHYAGVVHATKDLPRVTHILQAFSCPGRTEPLHMDVVAAQGNLWVKVVARKAQALHLVWAGEGQYGEKDIIQQAKDFITCSKVHPVSFEDPRIVFAFYNGVTEPIATRLERLGVIIVGVVVPVDCDVERALAQMSADMSDSDNEESIYTESGFQCPLEATCVNQLDHTHCDKHEESFAVNMENGKNTKSDFDIMTFSKEDYQSEEHDAFKSGNVSNLLQLSTLPESSHCRQLSPKHSLIENKCKDHPINSTVTLNLTNSVVETLNNIDSRSPEISQQKHVPTERLSNILTLQGSNQEKTNSDNMSKIELISEKQISKLDFGNNRARNVDCYSTSDNISTSPVLSFVAEELLITPAVDYTALRNLISANKINVIDKIGKVNLDITALITLVSAVSHGGCYFKFQEKVLSEQAAEERKEPVLPRLTAFLEGKEMYACETAVSNFRTILETLGGTSERRRAEQLLSQVAVVADQPSFRASSLPISGKLKERSKIIFGSGDALKAVTVTANSGFVRAAEHQGVTFAVFLHASRALTEQKEATAEILPKEA